MCAWDNIIHFSTIGYFAVVLGAQALVSGIHPCSDQERCLVTMGCEGKKCWKTSHFCRRFIAGQKKTIWVAFIVALAFSWTTYYAWCTIYAKVCLKIHPNCFRCLCKSFLLGDIPWKRENLENVRRCRRLPTLYKVRDRGYLAELTKGEADAKKRFLSKFASLYSDILFPLFNPWKWHLRKSWSILGNISDCRIVKRNYCSWKRRREKIGCLRLTRLETERFRRLIWER